MPVRLGELLGGGLGFAGRAAIGLGKLLG